MICSQLCQVGLDGKVNWECPDRCPILRTHEREERWVNVQDAHDEARKELHGHKEGYHADGRKMTMREKMQARIEEKRRNGGWA